MKKIYEWGGYVWVNTVVDVGGYCGAVLWGGMWGGTKFEMSHCFEGTFFRVVESSVAKTFMPSSCILSIKSV